MKCLRTLDNASGHKSPQRPSAQIAAEKVAHFEQVLQTLTEREQRQAQALARTRAAKRAAAQKLDRARARLTAETEAVARLGHQKDHRAPAEKEPQT